MWPARVLLSTTSRRTRVLLALATLSGVLARIAVFMTAAGVVKERVETTTTWAVVTALLWLVQRAFGSAARPDVQVDVNRAASRALLESDVLAVKAEDLHHVVWEGDFHARTLLGSTLPVLIADALAAAVLVPLAASELPPTVTALAAAVLVVLGATAFALRRTTRRLEEAVLEAGLLVNADLTTAIDGRLEIVAGGRESAHAAKFEKTLAAFRATARRSSLAGAIIGRAPLAAGIAVVALVALFDPSLREAVATVVFGRALVLAATAMPVLSAVLSANELLRTSTLLRPHVELLRSARRPELARQSGDVPALPAEVVAEGVGFTYAKGEPEVLSNLSFRWSKGDPLVLAGPNGSGKSTLLRLLVGLRPPTRGALTIGGRSITEVDLVALRKRVTFLPQRPYLGEPSDALRAVLRADDEGAVREALDAVGLAVSLDRIVGELSTGQRQRVALARILLEDRDFILLDEPDANLDAAGVAMVERLVGDMVSRGKMVAIATHAADFARLHGCRLSLEHDSK